MYIKHTAVAFHSLCPRGFAKETAAKQRKTQNKREALRFTERSSNILSASD